MLKKLTTLVCSFDKIEPMKRLLALLLLSPIAFAKVDLHCENLEKLPEGDYRNHLITLDIPNLLISYTTIIKEKKWAHMWESLRNKTDVDVYTNRIRWISSKKLFDDIYILNRETLKLKYTTDLGRFYYETTRESQCEIIDNKDEMLKYYKNKVKESKEYYKKLEEEQVKKNKI